MENTLFYKTYARTISIPTFSGKVRDVKGKIHVEVLGDRLTGTTSLMRVSASALGECGTEVRTFTFDAHNPATEGLAMYQAENTGMVDSAIEILKNNLLATYRLLKDIMES